MSSSSINKDSDSTSESNAPVQWDESIVLEYEARVEPFTGLFIQDMLAKVGPEEIAESHPSLLDVGCGSGFGSLLACEKGFRVTATDISRAMVERTRQRAAEKGLTQQQIQCLVADGQNIASSFGGQNFDYAMAAFSVIFFPNPAKALRGIYLCLNDKGGQILLSAWGNVQETPAFQIFPLALQSVLGEEDKAKPNRITGSPALLKSLLEDAGFQQVHVVGPVSHNVQLESAQAFYDRFALTSPKIKQSLEKLSVAEREKARQKVLELAEERGGGHSDGSISISSMAYLAYGTKR